MSTIKRRAKIRVDEQAAIPVYHHPRSVRASAERLSQLLGVIRLTAPYPPPDALESSESDNAAWPADGRD